MQVSYQWDVQSAVIRVVEALKQRGFAVWFDLEAMSGSTLDAMAEAIEGASCALVCMTAAYKKSALACHPDRFADADDAAKKEAEAKFKELGEALDILTDEFKRKLWDEGHDLDAIAQRVQMREQQQGRR